MFVVSPGSMLARWIIIFMSEYKAYETVVQNTEHGCHAMLTFWQSTSTMTGSAVFDALAPHIEAHQSLASCDAGYLSIDDRIAVILRLLSDFGVGISNNDGSALTENDDDDDSKHEELSDALMHFLDCAMATEINNDSSESIKMVLQIVAGVGANYRSVATALLDKATELNQVLLERVRATACTFIGQLAHYLKEQDAAEDILDQASQTLLPRFTDKSQIVRLAAIQAASHFFADTVDDPDLRQALCWSLQHDPSVTNRLAALGFMPLNGQTMDAVLARVRDESTKVRTHAWRYLQEKLELSDLPSIDLVDLVQAGLSER
jgi:hypothetical protein